MRTEKKTFVTSITETIDEMFSFLMGRRVQKPKPIKKTPTIKPKEKIIQKIETQKIKLSTGEKKLIRKEKSEAEKQYKENMLEQYEADDVHWNDVLIEDVDVQQEAENRVARLNDKVLHRVSHSELEGKRKQFLYMRIGDEKMYQALLYLKRTGPPPLWTTRFLNELTVGLYKGEERVFFMNLPCLYKDERKLEIKTVYFDPSKPNSQYQIHQYLLTQFGNITRKQVASTLHTLETYQILFRRQLPKKVSGRLGPITSPGVLCADTFYPSPQNGWKKGTVVLAVVDIYSRFGMGIVCQDKTKATIAKAFKVFLEDFLSLSTVLPRSLLIDKGSELMGLDAVMEEFRQQRKGPLVFRSLTATSVTFVESYNQTLQSKCQIYKEARIMSNMEDILPLVCHSLNYIEKRIPKMGYTPVELLMMNSAERKRVNDNYQYRTILSEEEDPLNVDSFVRLLKLDRKQQKSDRTKGFPANFSKEIYQVRKRVTIQKNISRFKYFITDSNGVNVKGSRFRHELLRLKITSLDELDRKIPKIKLEKKKLSGFIQEGTGPDSEWVPGN